MFTFEMSVFLAVTVASIVMALTAWLFPRSQQKTKPICHYDRFANCAYICAECGYKSTCCRFGGAYAVKQED